ncbi:MAG: hypothetical protein PHV99_01145 [Candidatus Pacebacteria bacterium]|nr:hypothetical protein [Candidatus Paceibacterota bacterium]
MEEISEYGRILDAEYAENVRYFLHELWPGIAPGAEETFKKGGRRAFEDFLEKETDGWIHAWDQFISDQAWECVSEWLTTNPRVEIREVFKGCDGCALCELMRNGEGGDAKKLADAFAAEAVMEHVVRQMTAKRETGYIADMMCEKDDLYYDAMELCDEGKEGAKKALRLLKKTLKMDEDYIQTYVGLVSAT